MSRRSLITAILTVTIVCFATASDTFAQRRAFKPRPLRWLGQGYGDGYHRCSPGYDSSHYNPYSAHNSFLYSQTPQFQQMSSTQNYAMKSGQAPQFFGGIPFSVYAAPPRNDGFGMQPRTGPMIDNSFEPVTPKTDSTSEAEQGEEAPDFEFDDDTGLFDADQDKQAIGNSVIERADSTPEESSLEENEPSDAEGDKPEEVDQTTEENPDQEAVYRRWIGPRLIPASYGKK